MFDVLWFSLVYEIFLGDLLSQFFELVTLATFLSLRPLTQVSPIDLGIQVHSVEREDVLIHQVGSEDVDTPSSHFLTTVVCAGFLPETSAAFHVGAAGLAEAAVVLDLISVRRQVVAAVDLRP